MLKLLIAEYSAWRHLKENDQLLCSFQFHAQHLLASKTYQLPEMPNEKKGNPKSSAGLKKPKVFFDFFPNKPERQNLAEILTMPGRQRRKKQRNRLADGSSEGQTDGQRENTFENEITESRGTVQLHLCIKALESHETKCHGNSSHFSKPTH